ncbi:MAG: hypothetical protein AAGK32_09310, partial [Actinomycetota bacterium]
HGENAHLRHRFDLERLVATIARTDSTHAEIERRAADLGLVQAGAPVRFRSVTDHAGRLLVHRSAPEGGRLDRARLVARQVWFGIEAARRRPDIGPGRKLLMAGWFVAAGVVPRRLLPRLASLALRR